MRVAQTLSECIRLRCPEGRADDGYIVGSADVVEGGGNRGGAVVDQEAHGSPSS